MKNKCVMFIVFMLNPAQIENVLYSSSNASIEHSIMQIFTQLLISKYLMFTNTDMVEYQIF